MTTWQLQVASAPPSWERLTLRSILRRVRSTGRPDLALLSVNLPDGVVLRREEDGRPAPARDLSTYQVVQRGNLVMNQLGKPHGALGVSAYEGIISPAYFVAEVLPGAEPRFVHHLLRSRAYISEYERRGKYMPPSQFDISWEQFRGIPVALPSLVEQQRIADYLDAELGRIDELIDLKQKMAADLSARAQSWQEALVLGLTRPGVEVDNAFVSHVPDGWGLTYVRHLRCTVQTGPFGSQLHAEDYIEGGWPVVNPSNLRDGRIVGISAMSISDEKRAELSRHTLRTGDIVFGRRGEMGRAGMVTEHEVGWLCGTGSLRLRLDDERITPAYLKAILTTSACKHYFTLNSVGSTMENLNADIVLACPVLVPPLSEQDEITRRLDEAEAAHAEAAAVLAEQIALLQERRRSLITAVVTGEMEVP